MAPCWGHGSRAETANGEWSPPRRTDFLCPLECLSALCVRSVLREAGETGLSRGGLLGAFRGRHAGTGVKQKGWKSLALNCPCGGLAGGQVYDVSHRLK